jgi:NAD+ kinase
MSDGAQALTVGIVGDAPASLQASLAETSCSLLEGDCATVCADAPDVVVTLGEQALLSVVAETTSLPVLPVAVDDGVHAITEDDAANLVTALDARDWREASYPVVGAHAGGDLLGRALCDLMLVTSAPARISEYTVDVADSTLVNYRADGLVVATPAGSEGYARAAGGPLVATDEPVASIVPVAPFATDPDTLVAAIDEVTLSVERDETAVELLADDRSCGPVPVSTPITLSCVDTLDVVVLPESQRW